MMSGWILNRRVANQLPDTTEAGDDLVGDQDDVVLAAGLGDALQVSVRWEADAAGADDGLEDEGGDPLSPNCCDELLELVCRVPGNARGISDQLTEAVRSSEMPLTPVLPMCPP
jgi:hypothetical protein